MSTNSTIRVFIADTHYLVRQGLKTIFAAPDGFEVVGETDDLSQILNLVEETQPDVVVVGLNIQGVSVVGIIEELRRRLPFKKILVLDTNEDANEIVRLLSMGVHGYILKQCDHQEIIDAVNTIVQGKNFFCSNVLKLNKTPLKSMSQVDNDSTIRLSEREIEILELISQGLTNNEIADRTFISSHTVASHRKSLMKKFGAKNNVDLVISAIKENFIAF